MKSRKPWSNFIKLVKAEPWLLFILSTAFFYLILPTSHKRPAFVRDVLRLTPADIRVELTKFEPEVDKFIISAGLAFVAVVNVQAVRSRRQSFED